MTWCCGTILCVSVNGDFSLNVQSGKAKSNYISVEVCVSLKSYSTWVENVYG